MTSRKVVVGWTGSGEGVEWTNVLEGDVWMAATLEEAVEERARE